MNNDQQKYLCFIGRGTPNHGLGSLFKREHFYYKYFAENFDHPVFLDVSKVFTSPVISKGEVDEAAHKLLPAGFKVIVPKDLGDFRDFLKSHAMIVVSHFSEEWYDWYIHYYLKKYKIPLIYVHIMSEVVNFQYKDAKSNKIGSFLRRSLNRVLEYLFCAPIDTMFLSNKEQAAQMRRFRRYKEIIVTNSRFYDSFLTKNYKVSDDYVVFLESMVPYHLDQVRFGYELVDRDLYIQRLNRVLDRIGQELGKEIVICLHPKYDDRFLEQDFPGRRAFKHRSDEFVAQAAVVLFHDTSTINSAVLYNKKVIQLTGSRFNAFIQCNCRKIQDVFGFSTLDIYEATDEVICRLLSGLTVDRQRYDAFLADYMIASGEQGVGSSRQIAGHIQLKYM